jgi:hypothetical protein
VPALFILLVPFTPPGEQLFILPVNTSPMKGLKTIKRNVTVKNVIKLEKGSFSLESII